MDPLNLLELTYEAMGKACVGTPWIPVQPAREAHRASVRLRWAEPRTGRLLVATVPEDLLARDTELVVQAAWQVVFKNAQS